MLQKQVNSSQESKFAALLNGYEFNCPRHGEVRKVTVLAIGDNDILVDLAGKRDGVIPPQDLDNVDAAYLEEIEVGDQIPVKILKRSRQYDGSFLVSLEKGLAQRDWLLAKDLMESGELVEAEVLEANRGGVLVSLGRLRAFVPNSHLTSLPPAAKQEQLMQAKEGLVGRTLSLVAIEVDQNRKRLIFSEREASQKKRDELLQELAEGDVLKGVVRNIVDFGVFVDIGGIDGLIHVSELAWEFVKDPRTVLNIGDALEVYVLKVDRERGRVGLSRKRVIPAVTAACSGEDAGAL